MWNCVHCSYLQLGEGGWPSKIGKASQNCQKARKNSMQDYLFHKKKHFEGGKGLSSKLIKVIAKEPKPNLMIWQKNVIFLLPLKKRKNQSLINERCIEKKTHIFCDPFFGIIFFCPFSKMSRRKLLKSHYFSNLHHTHTFPVTQIGTHPDSQKFAKIMLDERLKHLKLISLHWGRILLFWLLLKILLKR